MDQTPVEIAEKTGIRISQSVSVSVTLVFGAIGLALLLMANNQTKNEAPFKNVLARATPLTIESTSGTLPITPPTP